MSPSIVVSVLLIYCIGLDQCHTLQAITNRLLDHFYCPLTNHWPPLNLPIVIACRQLSPPPLATVFHTNHRLSIIIFVMSHLLLLVRMPFLSHQLPPSFRNFNAIKCKKINFQITSKRKKINHYLSKMYFFLE